MSSTLLLLRVVVGLYVLAAGSAFAATVLRIRKPFLWTPLLALGGLVAHVAYLGIEGIRVGGLPVRDYRDVLSLLCAAVVLVYLVSFVRTRLEVLGVVFLPLVLILIFISNFLPNDVLPVSRDFEQVLMTFHICIAVLGAAALCLTFAASVLYLVQERGLKEKRPVRFGVKLPSLEKCDSIGKLSLMWGFPLLTLTIVTGGIWSANFRSRYWLWEGKETFALLAWMILGVIITARLLRGWRGKKVAYLTIVAFAALILRMIGVAL
ncbi:MAG TPA: cytochrome c biogenesis protein CcsA [Candidatus Polarisedimenticolia bacterium]|nr:cytochrome c biogenesis protein CcsA [Candidatus Polarisedimenticolia bacterium]